LHYKDSVFKIHRYEKALFGIDMNNLKAGLKSIKNEYNFFLSGNLDDPKNLLQIKGFVDNPRLISIYKETLKKYPDLNDLEKQFSDALTHYHYYFPEEKIPKLYSYVSDLAYEEPIIYADSVLVIELDMYLGKDCSFYPMVELPVYKTYRCSKEFIIGDCMKEIAKKNISYNHSDPSFLNQIIYEGKILYFVDAMMPETPENIKIGYTPEQTEWCKKNEVNIWKFFVDQKILYQTDPTILSKFLNDAPFTPGFPRESPGQIGIWLGWQIIHSYMNNHEKTSLQELMRNTDAQKILKDSKYKPKK